MEEHLPGWYHDGYIENMANTDWLPSPSGELTKEDGWAADSRAMIVRDIKAAMQTLGIPAENFSTEGIIDPAAKGSLHSSHEAGRVR